MLLHPKSRIRRHQDRLRSGALRRQPAWWTAVAGALLLAVWTLPRGRVAAQDQPAQPPAEPPAEKPADDKLPKLQDLQVPSADELLTGAVRDWIVLKSGDVIICESVVPRPDTLAKREAALKALMDSRAGKSKEELEQINEQIVEMADLVITLPEDKENPEYRLDVRRIDRIIHHEDLMLQRIDLLVRDGNLEPGLEMLLLLERNWPDWPGLAERHNNLLFADAGARLAGGNLEPALVVLNELYQRAPAFPGLSQRVGEAIDQIVSQALARNDVGMARYFLLKLDGMYAAHPVFQQHAAAMSQRAEALLAAAGQARGEGRHAEAADLAQQAAELWPRTANLLARIKPFVERYQRLRVGVVELSTDASPSPFPTAAEERADQLMHAPLFELDRVAAGSVYYRTRYFEEWEPYDLGRTLRITLRQVRQPWESQPPLDAAAVGALIVDRIDPASPAYDERLAGYVRSVRVESPIVLTLNFQRVPPRIEPLLDAIVPAPAAATDDADNADAPVDNGGFAPVEPQADRLVFRRAIAEPVGLPQYHVAEVVEQKFTSHEKALQALREGQVSMLPDLPDWIVRRVAADTDFQKEFFIQKYAAPTTHVIQFNPLSPAVRIRELRRALLYALDRPRILRDVVLRDPESAHGRVVTSPFPANSPANSIDVAPRNYDVSSALAMVLAAAQQSADQQLPPLHMIVPAGPVERAAAAELIRAWKRVGLDVQIVDQQADAPVAWDLCYRTLEMLEPTLDLWPFLTASSAARVADLEPFPDWLKHGLVSVDRTSDWPRALNAVRHLHDMLWSDVRFVPLWEVDGYLVVRKNVQGFPAAPVHCYQNIDRWTIGAWFRTE